MKVLVVDDEQDMRAILQLGLADLGHTAVEACDGAEAIEVLGRDPDIQLILTDVRMPGMDGIELIKRLRELHPETPVAVMSGHADVEVVLQAMRNKSLDFLLKPFDMHLLTDLVERAESLWRGRERRGVPVLPARREAYSVELPTSREWVEGLCGELLYRFGHGLSAREQDEVRLAIVEATQNAIIHGNLGMTSDLKEEDWMAFERLVKTLLEDPSCEALGIVIEVRRDADGLIISIEDEGEGFEAEDLPDPNDPEALISASGRGLLLIQFAMDKVSWNDRGNRIEMFKRLPAA